MCDECWRLFADGKPVCEVCALELASGPASRWPFAVAFFGASVAICFAGVRFEKDAPSWGLWVTTGVIALGIALVIGFTTPKPDAKRKAELSERESELQASPELLGRAASPYRARIARVVRRVVPLSGRSTALVMSAAFVVSGVALPLGLRLPPWVELELVLGVWWLAIFATLTTLLYKNLRLAEDHRLRLGALTQKLRSTKGERGGGGGSTGWIEVGGAGCGDTSGCGEGIVIVIVLVVALAAALLLVEILLPIVFFAFYYFVVKAIGRVARDTHGCAGALGRSLAWGAIWATLYVAPVSLLTWGAHSAVALRHSANHGTHLPN